jgi:site-specific DNA-methyltransferase (adenine-specific)
MRDDVSEYDAKKDSFESYNVWVASQRAKLLQERCPAAKRVEVIGQAELYLGDCMEIMQTLGKVDAVVTDPPYEFETAGAGIFRTNRKNMDEIKAAGLDKGFDFTAFSSRQFGSAVFFAHNDQWAELLPYLANEFDRYAICQWHKTNPMPVANRHYQPDTEIYVHAWNSGFHPVGDLREKQRFIVAPNGQDTSIAHPTVKPLSVMTKIVGNVGGSVILDPFMGSGTTGVACVKKSKRFIGIERHEPYFDIACERIRKAYAQPDMFVSAPKPEEPKQEAFL